jgi:hypothetical protein
VSQSDLALVGDRAFYAEGLQADSNRFGGFGGGFDILCVRTCDSDGIRPNGVVKGYRLDSSDYLVDVHAESVANLFRLVEGGDTVFF